MSENIRISLGNPVLIFVYSVALLLIGCAIGMHWYQSRASAIWIAVAAAALMVVHDMHRVDICVLIPPPVPEGTTESIAALKSAESRLALISPCMRL